MISLVISPGKLSASSIYLEPSSGAVGSEVQINGSDFTGQYANVYWDGVLVTHEIPISAEGKVTYKLTIPTSPAGTHTVHITDDSNWSGSTATTEFLIKPSITVFPTSCREWTEIDIKGTGFQAYEKAIKLIWDNTETLNPPINADKYGTWNASFTIPNDSQGLHVISAFGPTTKVEEINKVDIIVVPWVIASPTTGPVGTQIVIKGWGFRVNEDGITITWDNVIIATNIRAEVDGSILLDGAIRTKNTASHDNVARQAIYVPPCPAGQHILGVYGSSFTPKGVLPDTVFTVVPALSVNPESTIEGKEITISGTGFAVSEPVTLNFDNSTIDQDIVADNKGSFTVVTTVPVSAITEHIISATGNMGTSVKTEFTSIAKKASILPPSLQYPSNGSTVAIFNSAGKVIISTFKYLFGVFSYLGGSFTTPPNLSTVFDWSDVENVEGGKYVLQVAPDGDFSQPTLIREVTQDSEYTLTSDDLITKGNYNWRVQAIDKNGDIGPWSETSTFQVISMPARVIALTSIILVLAVAAIVFGLILIFWRIMYR
jgi:hypothetical protein